MRGWFDAVRSESVDRVLAVTAVPDHFVEYKVTVVRCNDDTVYMAAFGIYRGANT